MSDENKTQTPQTPDPWAPVIEELGKVGLSPDDVIGAVRRGTTPPKQETTPNQVPVVTPDLVSAEVDKRIAAYEHSKDEAKFKAASDSALADLTKDADDATKELIEAAFTGGLVKATSKYPAGHPLAGQPKPLSDAEIASIRSKVEAGFKKQKSLASAIKDAKPVVRPAAGAPNVPPAPPPTPGNLAERVAADVEARRQEFIARLAGNAG